MAVAKPRVVPGPKRVMETAAPLVPPRPTLPALRKAAAGCQACELWKRGTQTVFGEGAPHAQVMLVGEQPGNDEDLAGHPFVGPAGKLLDRALEEAGIDRRQAYVTNVVKHFKWEPRGKRRIHAKPDLVEITACLPWLQAEIEVVKPRALVCLGATAAQAPLGRRQQRGGGADALPGPRGPGGGPQALPRLRVPQDLPRGRRLGRLDGAGDLAERHRRRRRRVAPRAGVALGEAGPGHLRVGEGGDGDEAVVAGARAPALEEVEEDAVVVPGGVGELRPRRAVADRVHALRARPV